MNSFNPDAFQLRPDKPRRLLADKFLEGLAHPGKTFSGSMDHIPFAHDGEVLHVQNDKMAILQLPVYGVQGNDAQAKANFNALLDGAVGIHLHAGG
jgi:hypothetical protein